MRRFAGITIFIVVVGLTIAVLGYRLVRKSLPDYNATIRGAQTQQQTTVYWDDYGVPHIVALNEGDLFRIAGYVMAQERLWQMDMLRRTAQGRLSEIFGAVALESDIFHRTWGFYRTAKTIVDSLSLESHAVLSAYTAGVNAFIDQNRGKLPIEFALLGYHPEPWRIEDGIAIARLLAFHLSFTWHIELTLKMIAEKVGLERALELFPDFPVDAPAIAGSTDSGRFVVCNETLQRIQRARAVSGLPGTLAASNSWVVAGSKSASGKPLLANDPHLGVQLPNIWFEMHLKGGRYDVAGMSIVGLPGIVIGHNRAIAWGVTNGMIDDADFYFEKIHPERDDLYWDGSAWQPMTIIQEKIEVKGAGEPHFLEVRSTPRGPIVSGVHSVLKNQAVAISVRWTGHRISDELKAILGVNRAGSWDAFVAALAGFQVPAQNFVYADTGGTIGYVLAGKIPIRRDRRGFLPYLATAPAGDWIGDVPYANLPRFKNPKTGFIATANNKISAQKSNIYFGNAWEPDSRIQRISMLLQAQNEFTTRDFQRMQLDLFSHHARKMLAQMIPVLQQAKLTEWEQKQLQLLREWDFVESAESVPATLYHVLFVRLLHNALADELEEALLKDFIYWTSFPIRAMENLITSPQSKWWDDVGTAERESRDLMIVRSFKEAIAELQERLGDGPGFWEWGLLHQVTFQHPMGEQGPLNHLVNIGPYAIGGSASSIAKAEFRFFKPYQIDVVASMRLVVDLAEPDRAWTIIAGGQSGQPFSEHYADQVPLWLEGKYKCTEMAVDRLAASAAASQVFEPDH